MSGDVEALIIGEEKDVQKLIKLCEIGPSSAAIKNIKVNDYEHDYAKQGFNIF
jgi:acylphosphatase